MDKKAPKVGICITESEALFLAKDMNSRPYREQKVDLPQLP
jgi:hypothetical protein